MCLFKFYIPFFVRPPAPDPERYPLNKNALYTACLRLPDFYSRSSCAGVLLALTSGGLGECPADTARRAQKCFTDLASGVATVYDGGSYDGRDLRPSGPGSGSGSGSETAVSSAMPLDYRKIREYCAE